MSLLRLIPGTKAHRRHRDRLLCQQTHERVQEIVDGEVPDPREREALLHHLEACVQCGALAAEIRDLKVAIARVGSADDPDLVVRLQDLARRLCEGTERGFDLD